MMEETDFQKEASNIAEFSAYLDSSGMHQVATCPFVYKPFSSRRCLPSDWNAQYRLDIEKPRELWAERLTFAHHDMAGTRPGSTKWPPAPFLQGSLQLQALSPRLPLCQALQVRRHSHAHVPHDC